MDGIDPDYQKEEGVTPHSIIETIAILRENLCDHVIPRRAYYNWAHRYFHLLPCDFFVGGNQELSLDSRPQGISGAFDDTLQFGYAKYY